MKSIYNFGIYCYKQLVALAGIRNVKARKLTQGQKGIFDYLSRHADPQGGYLWIHASSLGEFEQGRPLIEAIKKAQPDTKILLTFFSPSGYEYTHVYCLGYLPPQTNILPFLWRIFSSHFEKLYPPLYTGRTLPTTTRQYRHR